MYIAGKFYDIRIVIVVCCAIAFVANSWLGCILSVEYVGAIICQGAVLFITCIICCATFMEVPLKRRPDKYHE